MPTSAVQRAADDRTDGGETELTEADLASPARQHDERHADDRLDEDRRAEELKADRDDDRPQQAGKPIRTAMSAQRVVRTVARRGELLRDATLLAHRRPRHSGALLAAAGRVGAGTAARRRGAGSSASWMSAELRRVAELDGLGQP